MKFMMQCMFLAVLIALTLVSSPLLSQVWPLHPSLDQPYITDQPGPTAICQWQFDIGSIAPQQDSQDGPHYASSLFASSFAYAMASAYGMEIWADAYASDAILPYVATAATSATASGVIRLRFDSGCAHPTPNITIDWKPKFKLRASVVSANATAGASGLMAGSCAELGVALNIGGALVQSTEAQVSTAGAGGATIPVVFYSGEGANEEIYSTRVVASRPISVASCVFNGNISTHVSANETFWSTAECSAKCTQSAAGLDVDGVCSHCGAHSYVLYGWY